MTNEVLNYIEQLRKELQNLSPDELKKRLENLKMDPVVVASYAALEVHLLAYNELRFSQEEENFAGESFDYAMAA